MAKKGKLKDLVTSNADAVTALNGYLVVDTEQDGYNAIAQGHAIFEYDAETKGIYIVDRELQSGNATDPKKQPVVFAHGTTVYFASNQAKFPIELPITGQLEVKEDEVELGIAKAFLAFVDGAFNWGDYVSFQGSEAYVVDSLDDLSPFPTTTTTTTKAPVAPTTTTTTTKAP